jgi:DNA helicase-2/ATP-dependent DNA helicase PcrA
MSHTFTPEQLEILAHREGHALVNSVAGSGKTSTLVEFIARRIEEGLDPRRLIALMFNVSARTDFERKLAERLPNRTLPKVRTFNSLGEHLYKRLVQMGDLANFTLVTSENKKIALARPALTQAWKDHHGEGARPTRQHLADFLRFMTLAKADTRPPHEVFEHYRFSSEMVPALRAFREFERERERQQIYFYDDQLSVPTKFLIAHPDRWAQVVPPCSWVIVDEAQDVSRVQFAAVVGMAGANANVLVVGDDDQCIYTWRGAMQCTLGEVVASVYPDYRTYTLTRSFRYGHEVACFASNLITHNDERFNKITVAHESVGDTRITLVPQSDGQSSGLVKLATPWKNSRELHQAAVLVRYHAQALPLILELGAADIPFHVYGATEILKVPAIAALMAVLTLAAQNRTVERESLELMMRGLITAPTLYLKSAEVDQVAEHMAKSYQQGTFTTRALVDLTRIPDRFDDRSRRKVQQRADAIAMATSPAFATQEPGQILKVYMALTDFRTGVEESANTPADGREVGAYVDTFIQVVAREPDLNRLLDQFDELVMSARLAPPNTDHIGIRTLHSVKGQEFRRTVLAGWASGTFPRDMEPIEEERRLAYVGVTRALEELYILHPADQELTRSIAEPHTPRESGALRFASPFLFEGDLGAAQRLAAAVRDPETEVTLTLARPDTPQRYVFEADAIHVTIVSPRIAASTKGQRQGRVQHDTIEFDDEDVPPQPTSTNGHGPTAIEHPLPAGALVNHINRGVYIVESRRPDNQYVLRHRRVGTYVYDALNTPHWALHKDS